LRSASGAKRLRCEGRGRGRYTEQIPEGIPLIDGCVGGGRPASRTPSGGGLRSTNASARLGPNSRIGHRDIPGRRLPYIAAHAYLDIDRERTWEIVTDPLQPLRTAVEKELDRPQPYALGAPDPSLPWEG
jgi:hypothetical protein